MRTFPKHLRDRFRAAADYHGVSVLDLRAQFRDEFGRRGDVEAAETFLEPFEEYYRTESLSAHERLFLGYQ